MNTEMTIKRLPVSMLKPAKYNPRKDLKPGDPAYEKIKRSLHDFGYVDPVIWNEVTGNIVGGHQRFKVLTAEGASEIDCVIVHIENPQDEKALNIALNKAVGEWEPKALADLISDLQLSGYDVGATGFDAAEVNDLFSSVHNKDVKEDDFDVDQATSAPAFVEKGDVWLLGRHRLMCGDSTLAGEVDMLMDGLTANLCITDPPYACNYTGGTGMTIMNDDLKGQEFYEFLLAAMKNVYAHLADGGALYVFHSDAEKVNFFNAVVNAGFHYSTTCIWVKNALVIGRMDYQMRHEPVVYAFKDTARHQFYGDRKQTTVWDFDKPSKSKLHPTTKPLPLIAYPMRNSSQENGIVLDLFGGSGSTLMAAEQLNRRAFLMELDPVYASAIVRRYVASKGGDADVYVLRDGEKLHCSAVYTFTEEDALQGNMIGRKDQNGPRGSGVNKEVAYTLNTIDQQAVCAVAFAQNQRQEVRDLGDQSGALSAQPGIHQQTFVAQPAYCMTVGCYCRVGEEKAPTLEARNYKDPPVVGRPDEVTPLQERTTASGKTVFGTLEASMASKQWLGNQEAFSGDYHILEPDYTVRRLTPSECTLLQGYPRDWTDNLGTEEPTEQEIAWWSGVFEEWNAVQGKKTVVSRNRVIKWLKDPVSDAAIYKAMGNSVAVPCVHFVLAGIVWAEKGEDPNERD